MNSMNQKSIETTVAEVRVHQEPASGELINLAARIDQNRTQIKKDWEELARLDQILLMLRAREKENNARLAKLDQRPGATRQLTRR